MGYPDRGHPLRPDGAPIILICFGAVALAYETVINGIFGVQVLRKRLWR
jgi:hypothetical protein